MSKLLSERSDQSQPRLLSAVVAGVLLAVCAAAAQSSSADRATPRTDENSQRAHQQLVEKARRGRIDVYFVGDSITRRWGATDYPALLDNWTRNFFGWNAANFGWGADTTQNILWRLQNGELDGVQPRVVVVLAGTNNVGAAVRRDEAADAAAADVTRGVAAIVDTVRAKAPAATIVVTAVFPRNDEGRANAVINRINHNLSRLAGERVVFLNVNDRLADADGRLFDGMMGDGLHPTVKGYQVWADALKPLFTRLLGPPAAEDHAPPPTGDPSRAR